MVTYDPPYKTLFFVCYSTVVAIVATEAGLLDNSDSYAANQSYDAVVFGHKWQLVNDEVHPWCGFGLKGEQEVKYLAPNQDQDFRFIDSGEYELSKANGAVKG